MGQFRDVTFPDDVGRALNIGRSWLTRIIEGELNGAEERQGKRSQSVITIECNYVAYDEPSRKAIIDFFEVVEGPMYSFRVRNWLDFEAGYEYTNSGWSLLDPMHFATGDGAETEFQLKRRYEGGSFVAYRKVSKPRNDPDAPVKIYKKISGTWTLQTTGYTIDYATGIVTFSVAPANGIEIGWCGLYDLCCRFESETLNSQANNRHVQTQSAIRLKEVDE